MARAEIDGELAVIVLDKKLFSLKRKKRHKINTIVENGELEKIIINAPYSFIVKLFIMFDFVPIISDARDIDNKIGLHYRHIYYEEWYNPNFNADYAEQCKALLAEESDLPF